MSNTWNVFTRPPVAAPPGRVPRPGHPWDDVCPGRRVLSPQATHQSQSVCEPSPVVPHGPIRAWTSSPVESTGTSAVTHPTAGGTPGTDRSVVMGVGQKAW